MPTKEVLDELKNNRISREAYVNEMYYLHLDYGGCKKSDNLCDDNCDTCEDHVPESHITLVIKNKQYDIFKSSNSELKRAEKILHNN